MAGYPGGPSPVTAGLAREAVAELEVISSQAAYERFLAPARALEDGVVEECRANIALAYQNAKQGVDAVLLREAEVATLPGVQVELLRELPELAKGLAFAVLQAQRDLPAGAFGPLYERAVLLRRQLLKAADALAEAGLLARAELEAAQDEGRRDVVRDCAALARLMRRNEERFAGRSPVTPADVGEAELVAEQLGALLAAPADPRDREATPLLIEATRIRDRFWTLLTRRHDVLWRCGAWLYGRDVEERVPPLQSRPALVRQAGQGPSLRGTAVQAAQRRTEGRPAPVAGPDSSTAMERSKVRFMVRVGFDFPSR
ncbi:hypothetical protein DRW03_28770 [Corallococcus sp. H22C18031201]|nr:hypothetical protein DRW03_28770 [Corallococcus sp. H22C18031201]